MKNTKIVITLIAIIAVGLGIWVVMLIITWGDDTPNELLTDLGKTGASLSLITVVGGFVQWILKDWDAARLKEKEKLNFYRNILSDLKTVYDKVETARLLIEAHRTAKTYGEQMRELIDTTVILHNIKRALKPGFPKLDDELKDYLQKMIDFIRGLLDEYRENYKYISVLQGIDEARKQKLKEENLSNPKTGIKSGDIPSSAWEQIRGLDQLAILIDADRYQEYKSKFKGLLDESSKILRQRIPVEEEK